MTFSDDSAVYKVKDKKFKHQRLGEITDNFVVYQKLGHGGQMFESDIVSTISVVNRLQWAHLCVQIHLSVRPGFGETFMAIGNVGNENSRALMGRVKTSQGHLQGNFT